LVGIHPLIAIVVYRDALLADVYIERDFQIIAVGEPTTNAQVAVQAIDRVPHTSTERTTGWLSRTAYSDSSIASTDMGYSRS
jgi:hypothetical protein